MNAISEGEIPEGRVKGKELAKTFQEHGLDKDEAKKVWDVDVYKRQQYHL